MVIKKIGFICGHKDGYETWDSHLMAPAPMHLDDKTIRIYFGGWDKNKISRIRYVDVAKKNPIQLLGFSKNCVLDIGADGCFDENGVFPAHVYKFSEDRIFLYYTGFQLGFKIRHYNFGGLAISNDNGQTFKRASQAPNLDRSDEGLFVRAGQSIQVDGSGLIHCVYSAGSSWHLCNNELRPVYDIFYQSSADGICLSPKGRKIIEADLGIEHGLGRPQIVKLGDYFYIFYTRRIIRDMKYFIGCARSLDLSEWERIDNIFDSISFGEQGQFDNEMIYFPAVIQIDLNRAYLFYSGNYFGRDGIGALELLF